MTLVHHPIGIHGRLHFLTEPFGKKTLCGLWLHPTFWLSARPPVTYKCQECIDIHDEPESPEAA